MNDFVTLIIWVLVIGVVFAFLWYKGYLRRASNYVLETREELRKCSWPSWPELKGSTFVVMVAVVLLGVFTMIVDFFFSMFMRVIT